MFLSGAIVDVLTTELAKIADDLVLYCIVLTVILIIAGILIRWIKNVLRKIFK